MTSVSSRRIVKSAQKRYFNGPGVKGTNSACYNGFSQSGYREASYRFI